MATKIYNFDKIERGSIKIKFGKKEYLIKEPTVKEFAKISLLKLQEGEGQDKFIEILCPEIFKKNFFRKRVIDTITFTQKKMLLQLCFGILNGSLGDAEGKLKLEEIKEM